MSALTRQRRKRASLRRAQAHAERSKSWTVTVAGVVMHVGPVEIVGGISLEPTWRPSKKPSKRRAVYRLADDLFTASSATG